MQKEKHKKINRVLFWTPRILSILFVLFLSLFSLDVFGNNYTFWETILALFMHNIPSLILIALIVISWKYEIVGAITFILAGMLYIFLVLYRNEFQFYMISWSFIISGPAFLIGILFWLNWRRK